MISNLKNTFHVVINNEIQRFHWCTRTHIREHFSTVISAPVIGVSSLWKG